MIKIGPYTYEVPAPLAMPSFRLQQNVLPIVGRVVGVLLHFAPSIKSLDLKELFKHIDDPEFLKTLSQAIPSLGEVVASMPEGELERLTEALLGDATVSGWGTKAPVKLFDKDKGVRTFDQVMQGRTIDTWKLLWHAVQVWYPDFFSLAKGSKDADPKESDSKESST